MPRCAVISYRLGAVDGVSIEAAKWCWALKQLGYELTTIAGEGEADHIIEGLGLQDLGPLDPKTISDAIEGCDFVVVENLLSLPMNTHAQEALVKALTGRRAILRHHDLPWQRERFATLALPSFDADWIHVAINSLSVKELGERGHRASLIYNAFDLHADQGDREGSRGLLNIAENTRLALQPTRAIARKNIGLAIAIAEELEATYWLLGEAEDGYGPSLDALLTETSIEVLRGPGRSNARANIYDAYAASDVLLFPSSLEGFGNPPIEAAIARKPIVVGHYPVAVELEALGFTWFHPENIPALKAFLEEPDEALHEANLAIVASSFNLDLLPSKIAQLIDELP